MRAVTVIILLLTLALVAGAQQDKPVILDLKHEVVDLVYTVEDMEAAVRAMEAEGEDLTVKETALGTEIGLSADILFDFNSATLRPAATPALEKAAAIIKQKARGSVTIAGHTDSIGSAAYNQKLSERRAESVKTWFVEKGGVTSELKVVGFGATKPRAPNTKANGEDDPEGRQQNRRVEITIGKG